MPDQMALRLQGLLQQVKDRRTNSVEQDWLLANAAWKNKRVRGHYRSSTFDYRIPMMRRAIERSVIRAVKIVIPGAQFFEVHPGNEWDLQNSKQADSVRAYMLYLTSERMLMRRLITATCRSLLLYGQATIKTGVRIENREVWPYARPVDTFSYYVWPETATLPSDYQLVFEEHMMPWAQYERERALLPEHIKRIQQGDLVAPTWAPHVTQRLSYSGLTEPTESGMATTETPARPMERFLSITEVWLLAEDGWLQVWVLWNHKDGAQIIRNHRSEYTWPPYWTALARPMAGEYYTNGQGQDLEGLDVWFNDVVNQMEEARTIAALPPALVDPDEAPRTDELPYGPRKVWKLKKEFTGLLEVPDTSAGSMRVVQLLMGLINSIGGSGQIAEGQPGRNMPRAGYAVSQLVSLGMADIEDTALLLEQECLTPMLKDLYRLTVEFMPRGQLIQIPGTEAFPDPRTLTAGELRGGWDFQWSGSLQSQDAQMRSQKLLSFAQVLVQASPWMQQAGYQVNWPDLVKMIWRDGLGERGLEKIVVRASPMQQGPDEGGGVPGAGGGGTGVPGRVPASPEDMERQLSRQFASMAGGTPG